MDEVVNELAEQRDQITAMFDRHEERIADSDLSDERLSQLNDTLRMLERFWAAQSNFSGLSG